MQYLVSLAPHNHFNAQRAPVYAAILRDALAVLESNPSPEQITALAAEMRRRYDAAQGCKTPHCELCGTPPDEEFPIEPSNVNLTPPYEMIETFIVLSDERTWKREAIAQSLESRGLDGRAVRHAITCLVSRGKLVDKNGWLTCPDRLW